MAKKRGRRHYFCPKWQNKHPWWQKRPERIGSSTITKSLAQNQQREVWSHWPAAWCTVQRTDLSAVRNAAQVTAGRWATQIGNNIANPIQKTFEWDGEKQSAHLNSSTVWSPSEFCRNHFRQVQEHQEEGPYIWNANTSYSPHLRSIQYGID